MILITRLKKDNKPIKEILESKNIQCLEQPLYKIKHFSKTISAKEKKIFIVASYQSIKTIALKKNYQNIKNSIFFAVGSRTYLALKELKLKVKLVANDSNELLKKIKSNRKFQGYSYEYLSGNVYNKKFLASMKKLKKKINVNIIYELLPSTQLNNKTIKSINEDKIKVVMILSNFVGYIFLILCKKHKIKKSTLRKIKFVTMSKNSASHLLAYGLEVSWPKSTKLNRVVLIAQSLNKKV